jgi:hypothetical protein
MEHFLISILDSGCNYDESFDMSVCIRTYYIRSIRSSFLSVISIERFLLLTQCNQLHSLEQLPLSLCTYPFLDSYSIYVNPICQYRKCQYRKEIDFYLCIYLYYIYIWKYAIYMEICHIDFLSIYVYTFF